MSTDLPRAWRSASAVAASCFIAFFACALPSIASAQTVYYVSPDGDDANTGSALNPWATLQRAADQVRPGDTVHVTPGVYKGPLKTTKSGTPSKLIRFLSEKRWGALISAPTEAVWVNTGDWVEIEGFEITGSGRLGILNLGSFVRIIGNHVHNIPARNCPESGGAGIDDANYKGHDNSVVGNLVHDIGAGGAPCRRVHGIYHANVRGKVANNIAYRNQGWGIHLWHAATNVNVTNNLVFNNGQGGILIGATAETPEGNNHTVVANNIAYDNRRFGIEELGRTGLQNLYTNNLVYQNTSGTLSLQNGTRDISTVAADPGFVRYEQHGAGDYHLRSTSPAVGTGNPRYAPQFDFDGFVRPPQLCNIGPFQTTDRKHETQ